MSSSYIVESQESDSKKDDTLIIVVNDDGTIAVDQETLHNLIMNQSNANVSVVRIGQTDDDAENGDLTFTVDPPAFILSDSSPINTASGTTDTGLVDPFMEMDPEQLEKLETALQSEQAKQILGENVAAMLDMLTVEEEQNSIRYAIELDHCYTSRTSPLDPEPLDPLPIANSPDIDQNDLSNTKVLNHLQLKTPIATDTATPVKSTIKVKQPVGRPRKSTISNVHSLLSAQKSSDAANVKSTDIIQFDMQKSTSKEEENNIDALSSSESSESVESDNDSDFGPRGPRRAGVRARGGRRGLTTRGGSMAGTRRRGPGKRMDVDQVRRLDIEMAAAVNAMKSSDQFEKSDKISTVQSKKQLKTISSRKKDEISPIKSATMPESSTVSEKPLQTTNQVKANLINANMLKGDMILTKPGQGRLNQKVFFVQKKVVVKPNDLKSLGAKHNAIIFTKDNAIKPSNQIQTKLGTSEDGKLISLSSKSLTQTSSQEIQSENVITETGVTTIASPVVLLPMESSTQFTQKSLTKAATFSSVVKIKPVDLKKEKKKSENNDGCLKVDETSKLPLDVKTPDLSKKHVKKDQRKSPGHVVDTLGPALFSTPDIIRRVGSGTESKSSDLNVSSGNLTSDTNISEVTAPSTYITPTVISSLKTDYSSLGPDMQPETANLLAESESRMEDYIDEKTSKILDNEEGENVPKVSVMNVLQTPLDPASNTISAEGVTQPSEDSIVPNIVSDHSGIEGEEHLLATLEMEASKHEEELLAEALLLQEQLDVDLSDPTALDDSTQTMSEPLLSPSTFDSAMLSVTNTELSSLKSPEIQLPTTGPFSSSNIDESKRKDSKEPIQIVRGGRIITLPPIEAPATRSKRLQIKSEPLQKIHEPPKKDEKIHKPIVIQHLKHVDEMESEIDDEDDEEDNSDSEDDPNRLWCICKRPHNNRFMICCDVCEDWFHGKCVHVSKAMGQQMEEQGIEWVCPNCAKKKADGPGIKINKSLTIKSTKILDSPSQRVINESSASQPSDKSLKSIADTIQNSLPPLGMVATQCVVCKKEARNSSIYCSDACILIHAQETLTKDKPLIQSKAIKTSCDVTKPNSDARVIVFERRTGKVLTGGDAPTTSNLKTWLKEHPTFEVVRSSNLNTLQIGGKMITAIQTQGPGKIGKSSQQSISGQAKMVYTKVVGSKQTILAPNNKKMTVISNIQNANILSKPTGQVKHAVIISSNKSPTILKQMTIKTVPQQIKSPTPAKQIQSKKQEQKSSPSGIKLSQKSPSIKKSEPEPIRLNIRKTLAELLTTRIKETTDLKLTDEEISDLAVNIELELYKYFRDTGAKYKAKYRSLVFNIKDTKNLTLFRKIADRSLTPDAVVRLSPEEMASQELAEWREKETKHQLEMIKKNELDLMAQAKSIVVKTHKGEQIIENDGGIDAVDPKTPVQDIVTVLNSTDNTSSDILEEKEETTMSSFEDVKKTKRSDEKKKRDKDRERDKDVHRSRKKERSKELIRDKSTSRSRSHRSHDRSHDRRKSKDEKRDKEKDREKERDKDKDREKLKEKDKQKDKDRSRRSRRNSSIHSKSSHKENKDKEKKKTEYEDESKRDDDKKKEPSPIPTEKPVEDRLWRHVEEETTTNTLDGNDSDVSDREPSSTVNIKTPDINEEPEREKEIVLESESIDQIKEHKGQSQTVWRGFVNMVDVAKFFITAQELSGHSKDLMEDLPDTVDVVGRISHETVWDYISKMKKNGSKEILVIRLTAANDEEKIPYITLYSYLNSRSRLGVVGNFSKNIKDFYIMPFSSQSQIPPVLLPLSGPGFEDNRPHLLLGIIVRNKRKWLPHPLLVTGTATPKLPRKDPERSYTPPIVQATKDKAINSMNKSPQQETQLSEKSVVTQLTLNTLNKAHVGMSRGHLDNATISKIVPELSSKIDITSSPDKTSLEQNDDDEPYSPGDIEEDAENSLAKLTAASNLLSPAKNSTELQRKIDELNRQIEEQKQQIQTISSSFLGEAVPILPGLGHDPPVNDANDIDEAYSPTDVRSFTPPPPSISKFTQPILDKVSDITIPSNLQEILANVKRQECSKVDSYLPSKPSASFLTSINAPSYQKSEKSIYIGSTMPPAKETKSTLRSLSDLDLIKKAEEELAAVAAASISIIVPNSQTPELPVSELVDPIITEPLSPSVDLSDVNHSKIIIDSVPKIRASDQPKPPGVEDEDYPTFPSMSNVGPKSPRSNQKFVPKSGVVLSVKRKMNDNDDDHTLLSPKTARTKSRWGQGPLTE
ncbi:hypothetical protein PV327_007322 [Microctonus hyperodae]|uniref:Death-inducer obliterator 1 n=1 Tax=Microctonus hyperodae TaxID=165561 RepID=A0AA39F642_MICHY|nr:hypothetical protein PV327_007322 [Microctonus hyperodae]